MNSEQKQKLLSRGLLALLILFSGLAFMPFTGLSSEDLGWQLYAGAYQVDLDVNPDRGRPGSAFLFTGSGYPANALAVVYVDGVPVGAVWTDGNGAAEFLIQTQPDDAPGAYFVTLASDSNTSATRDFELDNGEPLQPPPPGFDGSVFGLQAGQYLPFIASRSACAGCVARYSSLS
jgi:hypothetical protein